MKQKINPTKAAYEKLFGERCVRAGAYIPVSDYAELRFFLTVTGRTYQSWVMERVRQTLREFHKET